MMKTVVVILCGLGLGVIKCHDLRQTKFGNLMDEIKGEDSLSEDCFKQLMILNESFGYKNLTWTHEMIDSWSTIPRSFQYGNSYDFGDIELCMKKHKTFSTAETIDGQFCLVQYLSKSNQTISQNPERSVFNYGWRKLSSRFGGAICVPATCSPKIVTKLFRNLLNGSDYEVALDYNQKDYCKTSEKMEKYSRNLVLFTCATVLLLIFAVSSTIYDLMTINLHEEKRSEFLLTFSLFSNGSKLFNVNKSQKDESIKCLNFIRFISAVSIVCLHAHYHRAMFPVKFPQQIHDFTSSVYGRTITGFTVSVDTFFVLSGLLVTRSILKDLDNGNFNLFKIYFQRYMRLTPLLAFVLIAFLAIAEKLVQTSPYAFRNDLIKPCESFWWSTLLHIQNQANSNELCLPATWYLSVEWQMFLIAPILIYPAWKFGRKYLLIILPALVLISTFAGYRVATENKLLVKDLELTTHFEGIYYQTLYLQTFYRGSVFIIGMILGVFFDACSAKFTINKNLTIAMWTFTIITFSTVSITFNADYLYDETSPTLNSLVISCSRSLWGISIAWVIFALEFGSVKWLGDFVSHKFWMPLGKLSFSIYLVHPVLQYALMCSQKQPIDFDKFHLIHNFIGDFFVSFFLAIFLNLFVEEPFTRVGKLISKNWSGKLRPKKLGDVKSKQQLRFLMVVK